MRKLLPQKTIAICMFSLLQFAFLNVFSQTGKLFGIVKDANGLPLAGASVTVGDKKGTITDVTGSYTLLLTPGTYNITISYVGYAAFREKVTVAASSTITKSVILVANQTLGEVTIGSRSRQPRTVTSTPVPVDIITMSDAKNFAQLDVSQMLTYTAPSFQSARQTVTDGTDHIDPAGLRSLGPDQTLVLLNGKRRHTTALVNINGSVGRGSVGTDLNAIPASAIERIEVLRDGAAAQYGSDAIAGVINIVLKKKFQGFTASLTTGENITKMPSFKGDKSITDGATTQLDFSGGFKNSKGGFLVVSGQILRRDKTNRSGEDNIPLLYYGNGGAFPTAPSGVAAADYRRFLIDIDKAQVAQKGYDRHNMVAGNSSADNMGIFFNGGIPISKTINFYGTLGVSERNGAATGNARIPNAITQMPIKADGTPIYLDGFLPEIRTKITDASSIIGLNGNFKDWNVDLSYTGGMNSILYNVANSGNASLAAGTSPTGFYAGELRFYQNTLNLDVSKKINFKEKNGLNIGFGAENRNEIFKIEEGEVNSYIAGSRTAVSTVVPAYPGAPSYPGTPGSSVTVSGVAVPGAQVFPGFQPADAVHAKRSINAGYADLELTLGKLLLGTAVRYESYKESKATYNGTGLKFTSRYEFANNFAIRGSVSTGFRAPSLHQRYFQNTSTQFVNGLPQNALTANNENNIVRNAFGINELKPETSTGYTLGFVAKLKGGFTVTVDGYLIDIKDRIVLSTQFQRSNGLVAAILNNPAYKVNASVSGLQFWTNAINTETKGVDVVISKSYKLGKGKGNISLAGNFNNNAVIGSLQTNSIITAPANNPSLTDASKNPANDLGASLFDRQQRSRIEVGQPKNKINLTVNYAIGKFNFTVRAVRFGEITSLSSSDPNATKPDGTYWNDVAPQAEQTFAAKITTDLIINYNINKIFSATIGSTNIFDVYPDKLFLDPRNDNATVYANPVASATNKTVGGYTAGRDFTNRGRFLFNGNQFGYNGRQVFLRLSIHF